MRRVLIALFLFFSPLFLVSDARAEEIWWAQQINENDWTEVVAPEGWQIVYVRGWYGSADGECGYDVSDKLGEIALNQIDFEFVADNTTFGDSCPGVYKVFRFTWGIVPLPEVVDPPIEPNPEPTVIPEPPIDPVDPPVEPPIDPVDPPVEPPIDPVEPPVVIPEPPVVPEPPIVPPIDVPTVPEQPETPPTEPIPPVVEPPAVEPPAVPTDNPAEPTITEVDPSDIDPQTLSDAEVAALITVAYATLESAEQGSPEYEQALEQLFVAAQADDIVIDRALASVPLLGNTVVALANAVNYLGNVGADMSPKVRAIAEKTVVSAVIVTQIATQAASMAVAASIGSVASIRRIN